MVTDIWLFSIFLLITGALIFILVFFIITLSGESISHTYWQVAQPCFIQIWSATTWTPKNAAAVWTSGTSRSCGCSWWSWRCCWCPATGASSSSTSPSAPGSSGRSTGCLGAISVRCLFSIHAFYTIPNLFSCTLLRSKHEDTCVHIVIHDEIKLLKLHSTYLEPCLTLDTLCLNVFSTLSCKLQNCNQTEGSHYKICWLAAPSRLLLFQRSTSSAIFVRIFCVLDPVCLMEAMIVMFLPSCTIHWLVTNRHLTSGTHRKSESTLGRSVK